MSKARDPIKPQRGGRHFQKLAVLSLEIAPRACASLKITRKGEGKEARLARSESGS